MVRSNEERAAIEGVELGGDPIETATAVAAEPAVVAPGSRSSQDPVENESRPAPEERQNVGDSPTSSVSQVANHLPSGNNADDPCWAVGLQQATRGRQPVDPPPSLPSLVSSLGRSNANEEQHVSRERPIVSGANAQSADVSWFEQLVGVNGNSESFRTNPLGGVVLVSDSEEYSDVTTGRIAGAASPFKSEVKKPMQLPLQLFESLVEGDGSESAKKIAELQKELAEAHRALESAEAAKKIQRDRSKRVKAESVQSRKKPLEKPPSAFLDMGGVENDDDESYQVEISDCEDGDEGSYWSHPSDHDCSFVPIGHDSIPAPEERGDVEVKVSSRAASTKVKKPSSFIRLSPETVCRSSGVPVDKGVLSAFGTQFHSPEAAALLNAAKAESPGGDVFDPELGVKLSKFQRLKKI